MMATEERDVPDWDQVDSETGKLLSDVGIGGAAPGRDRGGAAQIGGPVATDKNYNAQPRGQNISMCGLLSLEFYRPYFDVDTSQVKSRLLQAAWPLRKTLPFLGGADTEGNGRGIAAPDLYSPVWVSATLIFVLSVVANARQGTGASEFDKVSTSMYSVLAYLAVGSLGLWAFFRAHGVPLSAAEALSVYGYSLTPFLAAAPLCILSWAIRLCGLAAASMIAAIFVLRSAWPRLQEHAPERTTLVFLAAVAVYHFLWFLLLSVI